MTSPVWDAMIEAGCEAFHKLREAMYAREISDKPEDMDDFDEGDVCRAIYLAMRAADTSDGEVERLIMALEVAVEQDERIQQSDETDGEAIHASGKLRLKARDNLLSAIKGQQSTVDEVERVRSAILAAGVPMLTFSDADTLARAALSAIRNGDEGMGS